MKNLRISATVTSIFALLAVLALFFLFLALTDIAHDEEDLTFEWYTTGICIIILSSFTVSTFVTLGLLVKHVKMGEE